MNNIIEDITERLCHMEDKNNYYCFNNSIIHYKDDIYIMSYRVIKYKIYDGKNYHPWKIWDNGYKIFEEQDKKNSVKKIIPRRKKFYSIKFREPFGKDEFVHLSNVINTNIPGDMIEYDSTGILILRIRYDKKIEWEPLLWNDNIFGDQMNQDARLCEIGGSYYITYNGFIRTNDGKEQIKMFYRKFIINLEENFIYLFPEMSLLPSTIERDIEKNCVLDTNGNILYSIQGKFTMITSDGDIVETRPRILQELLDYYGHDKIYFSFGSSPIRYKNKNLGIGHVKIAYKCIAGNIETTFKKFLNTIDFQYINAHGKYIYFMFLYEYNDKGRLIRMSDCFIPTDIEKSHLPYLLVFPGGMSRISKNEYIISYGEGDCRCKLLYMKEDDIEDLLQNVDELMAADVSFFFYQLNYKPLSILHIGYFKEMNCGDDAFMIVFRYLNRTYYPTVKLKFATHVQNDNTNYDLICVGGGDIINPYFIKNLQTVNSPLHAIGVGIPYTDDFKYLNIFDSIVLRNSRDKSQIDALFPNKTIKCFPDLAFILKKIFINLKHIHRTGNNEIFVGFCLTRTYHQTNSELCYMNIVMGIVNVIKLIKKQFIDKKIKIFLIPFCNHLQKLNENDNIMNQHIKSFFRNDPDVIDCFFEPYFDLDDYVFSIYSIISNMDFLVCSRFHAHIFSICLEKPFISLSCSRKCKELMFEYHLEKYYFKLNTNPYDVPNELDPNAFFTFFKQHFENRAEIIHQISDISKNIHLRIDDFIQYWVDFIYSHLHLQNNRINSS